MTMSMTFTRPGLTHTKGVERNKDSRELKKVVLYENARSATELCRVNVIMDGYLYQLRGGVELLGSSGIHILLMKALHFRALINVFYNRKRFLLNKSCGSADHTLLLLSPTSICLKRLQL